ncbi:Crp/Fnr family transcriptional regulator [Desulfospira joergensenii]|uniref:Crp/Fnr family transcriptional regulator n=1 Tax=Desulfospira joergensenii TaxID=53329 RepID=UPI0003B76273|nr:cyclic nucleotide-binding domain-containing protein [Desulfospira joergensenii]
MVGIEKLKKINFLKNLPEEVLEKISTVAQLENFDEETILIRQDQVQHLIYMLVSGKIYINCRAASGKVLTLDELTSGQTFGLSSLLDNSPSTYTAICAEDSKVISISSEQLLELANSDHTTGYHLMKQVVEKFKTRMTRHTRLFMAALAAHPAVRQVKSDN